MKSFVLWSLHGFHMLIRPIIVAWYSVFESHRVRVVVKHGDQFLFVKTSFSAQLLSFPGGGIERKESPLEAAVRELREETGIVVSEQRFRHVGQMHTAPPAIPFRITVFEVEVETEDLPPLAWIRTLEIVDRQWIARDRLPLKNQVVAWYLAQG